MSRVVLSVVVGLLIGNMARAEVVVELVPDNPGPYRGGETLTVDVWLHSGFRPASGSQRGESRGGSGHRHPAGTEQDVVGCVGCL